MKNNHYDILKAMTETVKSCEQRFGSLDGKKVLDISCHDGSLLSLFQKKGAVAIGLQPTTGYFNTEKKDIAIYNQNCSKKMIDAIVASHGNMDFITATAYIENIHEVFRLFEKIIGPQTVVVIENYYLGPVLNDEYFDIFYAEIPNFYRYAIVAQVARSCKSKFIDIELPSHFVGNLRVFLWNQISSNISGESIETEDLSMRIHY